VISRIFASNLSHLNIEPASQRARHVVQCANEPVQYKPVIEWLLALMNDTQQVHPSPNFNHALRKAMLSLIQAMVAATLLAPQHHDAPETGMYKHSISQ
jgi:hypothetical protein